MTFSSATALLAALMLSASAQAAGEKPKGKSAGFDPKSFLLKLVSDADKDGDGALSTQEFQKLPMLREVQKDKVDQLFASIDTDSNGALSTEEMGKGVGKITDLVKAGKSSANDDSAGHHSKKLKRLLKK